MWVYNIEEEVDVNGKSVYGEKEWLGSNDFVFFQGVLFYLGYKL